MSQEVTWICDRCGARHTGIFPSMWKRSVGVVFTAANLPDYSPYHVTEKADTYCDSCMTTVADAIRAALRQVSQ